VVDRFNHLDMAKNYLAYYEKVLNGEKINTNPLFVAADQHKTLLAYDW